METPSDGLQLSQIIYGTGGLTASLQQQQQQHNGGLKDSIDIVVAAVWSQVAEDAINNSVIECIDDYNKKYGRSSNEQFYYMIGIYRWERVQGGPQSWLYLESVAAFHS